MAMKTITYYEIVKTNFENFPSGLYPRGIAAGMKKGEKKEHTHMYSINLGTFLLMTRTCLVSKQK
jgi:hypothetical protein